MCDSAKHPSNTTIRPCRLGRKGFTFAEIFLSMMLRCLFVSFFCFLALSVFCQPSGQPLSSPDEYFAADSGLQTGGVKIIPIRTAKGDFKVWTKRIGNNPKMKVLLLTGGPGASHEYLECFENFFPKEGIEFIYYDQLGTGNSDVPKDTSLYDLDRSVDEVEQVRKALHLSSGDFFLFGHSWGGIVALEYALKYQQNLKGLIISNMMSSASDYNRFAEDVLARQLDPKVLAEIRAIEGRGDFENPRYMELLMPNFYAKHICRLPEWPEPVTRSFGKFNQAFYVRMQGPSEFGLSGKLVHWERKGDLSRITVPTLTIGARFDTMDPDHMEWMAGQVKNGSYLYCPNGSHMCFYDDQRCYFEGLTKFIKGVEEGGGLRAVREAIGRSNRLYSEGFETHRAELVVDRYSVDGAIMAAGSRSIMSREGFLAFFNGGYEHGIRKVILRTTRVFGLCGEFVNEEGGYELKGDKGQVIDRGKYLVVWKRVGREWKMYRDIFNTDGGK